MHLDFRFNMFASCHSRFTMTLAVFAFLALAGEGCPLLAQDGGDGTKAEQSGQVDAETQARYDEFSKLLTGTRFVGNFTVVGQEMNDLTAEEYHIKSVKKMPKGDMWLFTARIKYNDHDVSVPIPLQVKWAGDDTPIITVTDFSMFGIGPFSSRVVVYNGKYAGTWSHGEVGGHLFGEIKPGAAEGVDVEKSKKEMEEKQKQKKKSQGSGDK